MDDADYAVLASEWADMTSEEKETALGRVANDTLGDWGYDPVTIDSAELDGAAGEYSEGSITFDANSTLTTEPFDEALDTAFHETGHAMDDQAGGRPFGGDYDDYNAIDPDAEGGTRYVQPGHEAVDDFAASLVDEVRAGVQRMAPPASDPPAPVASESGGGGSFSAEDFTFEIDYANVTVTNAGPADGPGTGTDE